MSGPQPHCVVNAILCAWTWGTFRKDEVRIAVFKVSPGIEHSQAMAKIDGTWLYLTEAWRGDHLEIVSSSTRNYPEAEETPYRYASLEDWIDENIKYTLPDVATPAGAYTRTDTVARPFPTGSAWLIDKIVSAHYLQGRMWWMLEELAKSADISLIIMQACPLTGIDPNSTAHYACDTPGGGMMADVAYIKTDAGGLDAIKFTAIFNRFLEIACTLIPGKEWMDVANESEIRVGGDVAAITGWFGGNRHFKIDDKQEHRFDAVWAHWHCKADDIFSVPPIRL